MWLVHLDPLPPLQERLVPLHVTLKQTCRRTAAKSQKDRHVACYPSASLMRSIWLSAARQKTYCCGPFAPYFLYISRFYPHDRISFCCGRFESLIGQSLSFESKTLLGPLKYSSSMLLALDWCFLNAGAPLNLSFLPMMSSYIHNFTYSCQQCSSLRLFILPTSFPLIKTDASERYASAV